MCGIVGYVGNEPANIDKIKILGLYNTTRGTDSCGIVINDVIKKGIGKQANFSNFIEEYKLNTSQEHANYTILLHTRSASNKTTVSDINCAHPFAIPAKLDISKSKYKKLKSKNQAPEQTTALIGVHNGFITNDDDLAKQYDVKEHKVDSGTILSILAEKKFDVLKEYEGAAVLLFYYPDEPNTLYIWKGAKRKYKTSDEFEEERPMFIYKVPEKQCYYFSSIKESLYAIGGDDNTIKSVEKNCLIKAQVGKKFRITPIARDKVEYNYDSYYGGSYQGGVYTRGTNTITPSTTTGGTGKKENKHETFRNKMLVAFKNYPNKKINTNPISVYNSTKILLDNEPLTMDFDTYGSKIYFHRGRYYRNGHMIRGLNGNGSYIAMQLDNYGFPKGHKYCSDADLDTYYFFEGLLCRSEQHAKDLQKAYETLPTAIFNDEKERRLNLMEVRKYIFGFVGNALDTTGSFREGVNIEGSNYNQWATGEFNPMFDYNKTYKFSTGTFESARYDKFEFKKVLATMQKFNPETKVDDDPITENILSGLPTVTEQEHEDVSNALQDSQSSLKNASKQLDKVKDSSKYSKANGWTKSALVLMKKAIESIDLEEDDEELISDERGILYS